MTDEEAQTMRRENAYLKQRCAQLADDVSDLAGQLLRTQQQLERMSAGRSGGAHDLSEGSAA